MNRKRLCGIAAVIAVCVMIIVIGGELEKEQVCTVEDQDGNKIGSIVSQNGEIHYECDDIYKSYIDVVYREAILILCEQYEIDEKKAQKKLVGEELNVITKFSHKSLMALQLAYDGMGQKQGYNFAAAISDIAGNLLACYSASPTETENYVLIPTYAGSTMKPLSVYGPAIEEKKIHWSSMYVDSPYTQINDEKGNLTDWPTNTQAYSNQPQSIEAALRTSNNAIAVKTLKDYGVEKSCRFLQGKFNMKVEDELRRIKSDNEDSVLSNVALGYWENGVTVKDMLSYYRVFANGGVYKKVHAISEIHAPKEGALYKYKSEEQPVFSPDTAYIMNRLLKCVIEEGGTGEAAGISGVDIIGKTGTSDGFRDNWFVGDTPEYVCAVWYGSEKGYSNTFNEAADIFNEVMLKLNHNKNVKYVRPANVIEQEYCERTGKAAGEYCQVIKMGWYSTNNMPEMCDCR